MNIKHLSTFLVTGTLALGASSAMADSSDTAQFSFSCQVSGGIPTTVAQPTGSENTLPIFSWKQDILANRTPDTPQKLCDKVAAELQSYSATGYDLSQISFVGTEQAGLPAICATTAGKDCKKMLVTLKSVEQPSIVAQDVVSAILNPDLQGNKTVFRDRGVQATSYQVNFWDLFGFGPSKSTGKFNLR